MRQYTTQKRLMQTLLIVSFVGFCWLAMQAVHEAGHVLGAWASGGRVDKVVLHPLVLSRTDLKHNPHPLFVVWAGPIVGSVIPLATFLGAAAFKFRVTPFLRFFAGFCLIANGVYIGLGGFSEMADAGDMLHKGSSLWQLLLFGVIAFPLGLYLWNGLGQHFGMGEAKGMVSSRAVEVSLFIFLLLVFTEIIIKSR